MSYKLSEIGNDPADVRDRLGRLEFAVGGILDLLRDQVTGKITSEEVRKLTVTLQNVLCRL